MIERAGLLALLVGWAAVGCGAAGAPGSATPAASASASASPTAALAPPTAVSLEAVAHPSKVQPPADEPFMAADETSFSPAILEGTSARVAASMKAYLEASASSKRAARESHDATRAVRDCELGKCPDGKKLEAQAAKTTKAATQARDKLGAQRTAALAAIEAEIQQAKDQPLPQVLIAKAALLDDPTQARELLTRAKVATQGDEPLGAEARFRLGLDFLSRARSHQPVEGMDRNAALSKAIEYLEPVVASKSGVHRDRALFNMALVHLERGDHPRAEGPLMTLSKGQSAWRAHAMYALGTMRFSNGRWADALGWFVRALDAGFVPVQSPMRLAAAEAAADVALRQSALLRKAPGHPVTERDAVLALTTHEMASMRPDVLCTIALHAIREALERNDWVAAVAAAQVLLDRAPQSIEAPVAVALLAADAASRSNDKLATELRQRLASQYAPGSEWAASLRKSRPQTGEADIRFAQSLGQGAKEAMVAPEELTVLKGAMPPLHRAEPRLEEQLRLLVDHCLFPFGDRPIRVSLSVVGAPPAEPAVTVRDAPGAPASVTDCLRDDAFAYLRHLPAQPRNVEVQ